jgi:hypothetical protein
MAASKLKPRPIPEAALDADCRAHYERLWLKVGANAIHIGLGSRRVGERAATR